MGAIVTYAEKDRILRYQIPIIINWPNPWEGMKLNLTKLYNYDSYYHDKLDEIDGKIRLSTGGEVKEFNLSKKIQGSIMALRNIGRYLCFK